MRELDEEEWEAYCDGLEEQRRRRKAWMHPSDPDYPEDDDDEE